MNYVMVQNEGEIPVDGIRLLGESSKSDTQIGMFGTGLKETIALSFRLGVSLTICSGETVIKFVTKETNFRGTIANEIGYEIDGTYHPMNITTSFGKQDWTSEWQMLREIYCNAQDEGGLHHCVVDKVEPVAGCTKVYLEATFDLLQEWQMLPTKLLFLGNRTPVHQFKGYKLYQGKGRIYKKGVFVAEKKDLLYDYELPGLKLTESRTAERYDVEKCIVELISLAPWELQSEYIESYKSVGNRAVEFTYVLGSYKTFDLGTKYHELYPDDRWLYPTVTNVQRCQALGYNPVQTGEEYHVHKLGRLGFKPLESSDGVTLIKQIQNPYAKVLTYLADVKSATAEGDKLLVPHDRDLKQDTFLFLMKQPMFGKACEPYMDQIMEAFK